MIDGHHSPNLAAKIPFPVFLDNAPPRFYSRSSQAPLPLPGPSWSTFSGRSPRESCKQILCFPLQISFNWGLDNPPPPEFDDCSALLGNLLAARGIAPFGRILLLVLRLSAYVLLSPLPRPRKSESPFSVQRGLPCNSLCQIRTVVLISASLPQFLFFSYFHAFRIIILAGRLFPPTQVPLSEDLTDLLNAHFGPPPPGLRQTVCTFHPAYPSCGHRMDGNFHVAPVTVRRGGWQTRFLSISSAWSSQALFPPTIVALFFRHLSERFSIPGSRRIIGVFFPARLYSDSQTKPDFPPTSSAFSFGAWIFRIRSFGMLRSLLPGPA